GEALKSFLARSPELVEALCLVEKGIKGKSATARLHDVAKMFTSDSVNEAEALDAICNTPAGRALWVEHQHEAAVQGGAPGERRLRRSWLRRTIGSRRHPPGRPSSRGIASGFAASSAAPWPGARARRPRPCLSRSAASTASCTSSR